MKLNLSQKAIALVLAPLAVWIFVFCWLAQLQDEAEMEASESAQSKKISDSVNTAVHLIMDRFTAIDTFHESTQGFDFSDADIQLLKELQQDFRTLDKIITEPEQRQTLERSKAAINEGLSTINQLRSLYSSTGPDEEKELKKRLNKRLKKCGRAIISSDFVNLSRALNAKVESSPEKQALIRQREKILAMFAILANITFTILLVLFMVRGITNRIQILSDNVMRLASNQPLNKRLSGTDELARLDRSFHEMATELAAAVERETALIRNATNMICSIDSAGRFVDVSPASLTLLGKSPTDLIGYHYIDMVNPKAVSQTLETIANIKTGEAQKPFEMPLKRADGRTVTTQWSCSWSEPDEILFCVVHDISERKEIEQMKQDLVNMVSHDLRSPAATVASFLDMLGEGVFGSINTQGEKLRKYATNSITRMMTLINDLLGLEKIKAGMVTLESEEFEIEAVIEQCFESVSGWAIERCVRFDSQVERRTIYGDKDRVGQILTNLLGNAVKFSPQGSTVIVKVSQSNHGVAIAVEDQGRGIPANMLENIFERFQQTSSSDAKNQEWFGAGSGDLQGFGRASRRENLGGKR